MAHDHKHSPPPPAGEAEAGYEHRDVNVLYIGVVTFGIVLVLILSFIWLDDLFYRTREALYQERVFGVVDARLTELRVLEQQTLTTYGVVDATKGVYRIPVEQAIEKVANEDFARRQAGK